MCDHGNSQNLIDHLQPLLKQYGAHYLSGHDHCMEALADQGVYYIVSGLGDTCCYEASRGAGRSFFPQPAWTPALERALARTLAGAN